ncbi:hypothetical protein VUR80DRAFT_5357 [Thermomyces stellatus]
MSCSPALAVDEVSVSLGARGVGPVGRGNGACCEMYVCILVVPKGFNDLTGSLFFSRQSAGCRIRQLSLCAFVVPGQSCCMSASFSRECRCESGGHRQLLDQVPVQLACQDTQDRGKPLLARRLDYGTIGLGIIELRTRIEAYRGEGSGRYVQYNLVH